MFKNYKKRKAIKQFVKTINPNYKVCKGNSWSSLWTKGKVWYTFKEQEGDKEYLEYLKKIYHLTPNLFIISLLHEIGHLETENQELSDNRAIEYATLEYAYDNNRISKQELYYDYFDIEAERLATKWAVDYYKNHSLDIWLLIQEL